MKICVLGGCGAMARAVLKPLADEKSVKKVVIADLDGKKAVAAAKKYGEKFEGRAVNALDRTDLIRCVSDSDVVMGYVGPFYIFEEKIASACIEAGRHYVSIADDYDAYLAVIKLHEEAEKAGVTIITGLGNSPGLTNMLAKKGYMSMSKPRRINIQWTGGSDEEVGPANVKHVMHIFSGTTLQWMEGREVRVKTGTGEKVVQFPDPIGEQTVFYTGHAESVSVPRNLPGLEEVTLHGGIRPVWVARLATRIGELGLTSTPARRERLSRVLSPPLGVFKVGDAADRSVFRIDVYGEDENGRERHHYYTGVGPIAEITSYPCLEGALMIGSSQVRRRGVFAPEAILNPDTFLPRVARRGVLMNFYEGGPIQR